MFRLIEGCCEAWGDGMAALEDRMSPWMRPAAEGLAAALERACGWAQAAVRWGNQPLGRRRGAA